MFEGEILPGPDLLPMFVRTLIKFRKGKKSITADIEHIFLQVKLEKEDTHYVVYLLRFL